MNLMQRRWFMAETKYYPGRCTNMLRMACFLLIGSCQFVYAATALFPDHAHLPIEVPAHAKQPQLSLNLSKDTVDGFNLQLLIEHFVLGAPPPDLSQEGLMTLAVDQGSGLAIGHGHLYVNGHKHQRLYGNNVHLPSRLFLGGVNQITVTLNNHGHRYWSFGGRQVLATLFIKPGADKFVIHRFDSFPVSSVRAN
jgi:hypothetical protein